MKSVFEESAELLELPAVVVEQLSLSAVESSLCLGLMRGKPVEDIADDCGQPRELIRAYFHKLLMKTGTDNEAKLVAVLLSLSRNQFVARMPKSNGAIDHDQR